MFVQSHQNHHENDEFDDFDVFWCASGVLQLRLAVSCCLGAKSLGAHTVGTCGGRVARVLHGTSMQRGPCICMGLPCNHQ